MRKDLFWFAAGAVMTALAVKYGAATALWNAVIIIGSLVMVFTAADGAIRAIHSTKAKLAFGILTFLIIAGAAWYFVPADEIAKILTPLKYLFSLSHAKPVEPPKQPAPSNLVTHPANGAFRVIVGSFLDREEAQAKADAINQENPSIKAFVADPPPCNDYFAVVASPFLSRADATKALADITKLKNVQGKAYLSPRSNGECTKPSFPCTGDLNPDERTICEDEHLAELDQAQNDSFTDFQSPFKREIGRKILAARGACETNKLCLLDQQLFAIATFSGDGIDFPSWTGDYRLHLYKELLNELETPPPQCTVTAISKISSDEIEFADGSYEVVPPDAALIVASREKDMVLICLVSTQKKCPLFVFGKKVYSATNLRTQGTWVLPDSNAKCEIE